MSNFLSVWLATSGLLYGLFLFVFLVSAIVRRKSGTFLFVKTAFTSLVVSIPLAIGIYETLKISATCGF